MTSAPARRDVEGGSGPAPAGRPGLRSSLLLLGAGVLARLPEAPLVAAAESIGEIWYRISPARAAQARVNLRRVCEGLEAQGRGTRLARRASTDPEALEQLVRRAFRHAVRYYLEVARTGSLDIAASTARIDVETPDEVRDALMSGQQVMIIGLHFGALELPAIVLSSMIGHNVTAPMEAVADPALQRWFMETRGRVGVNIVPVTDARRSLMRAIRRGESVGMVADRDIMGNGLPVPFFGQPAPIPAGPALLAVETGLPVYVGSARRKKGGRYAGKLILVDAPLGGTRRERVTALTAAIAAAFELIIADAPEQWWGSFHAIWPDLDLDAEAEAPASQADAPADAGAPGPGEPA